MADSSALWTVTDDNGVVLAIKVEDGVLGLRIGAGTTFRSADPQAISDLRAKLAAAQARQLSDRDERWPS